MTLSIQTDESRPPMKIRWAIALISVTVFGTAFPVQARSQSSSNTGHSMADAGTTTSGTVNLAYVSPPPSKTLRSFTFDALGPYAVTGAALAAGLDQATNTPPQWKQGFVGYSERFGSDFGIEVVGTTTRYGLAAAFMEDTSFYPCDCRGFFTRLRHAAISTFTARRHEDGHRVFSIPGVVAPYAGTTAAVYGWYSPSQERGEPGKDGESPPLRSAARASNGHGIRER